MITQNLEIYVIDIIQTFLSALFICEWGSIKSQNNIGFLENTANIYGEIRAKFTIKEQNSRKQIQKFLPSHVV